MAATIDIEQPLALQAYLRRTGRIGAREEPLIQPLGGGVSNRVMLVQRPNGEAWVIKQALRRLRVAVEWYSSPERSHAEALGLRWLPALAPAGATTPLIFEDQAEHIVAAQAAPQPNELWKTMLLAGRIKIAHAEQFGTLLGTIQRCSAERQAELASLFNDRSFFETLRIEPYYIYTWTQTPQAGAFFDALISATRTRRQVLVHGDYSPKNILVHNDRLILIDHEVIHFGDPAFDSGFALAHLLSKANHVATRRDALAEAALRFWQAYCAEIERLAWASGIEQRVVRHTLGVLLARVVGRSQLTYLTRADRQRQQSASLALIAQLPASVPELIEQFLAHLAAAS